MSYRLNLNCNFWGARSSLKSMLMRGMSGKGSAIIIIIQKYYRMGLNTKDLDFDWLCHWSCLSFPGKIPKSLCNYLTALHQSSSFLLCLPCGKSHCASHLWPLLTLFCSSSRNQMWNLKPKNGWVTTPLTSIPWLELWSIGKLNTSLTPNTPDIVFICCLLLSLVVKMKVIVN